MKEVNLATPSRIGWSIYPLKNWPVVIIIIILEGLDVAVQLRKAVTIAIRCFLGHWKNILTHWPKLLRYWQNLFKTLTKSVKAYLRYSGGTQLSVDPWPIVNKYFFMKYCLGIQLSDGKGNLWMAWSQECLITLANKQRCSFEIFSELDYNSQQTKVFFLKKKIKAWLQ